jgi:nucleotide-binding universal stress UspA family protein
MFKHILIPTDGSDLSRKALLYGVELARESNAKVTALTIREPYMVTAVDTFTLVGSQEEFEMTNQEIADRALEQARMAGEAAGVAIDPVQEVHDQPYRAIIDCALANRCDLIVMASHGRRGVSALLLGSVTTKVLTHSKIPVLVYR